MTPADRSRTDHDTHDLLLVAAHAAGDIGSRGRSRTELQLAGCRDCADLRAELVAIAAATNRLPAPRRSREFTLSREDAARLRRPSLRRILVDLAGPRGLIGRPVAAAVTSLGVAGIVLASAGGIVGSFGSAGAAAPAPTVGVYAPGGEPKADEGTAAPEGFTGSASGDALVTVPPQDTAAGVDRSASAPPGVRGQAAAPTPGVSPDRADLNFFQDGDAGSSRSPLVLVSIGLVALGLALFVLRRIAARLV